MKRKFRLPILLTFTCISAFASEPGGIIPLFDSTTKLEPATSVDTPAALITHIADRARDRHAREDLVNGTPFRAYDHYLSWYWEERTIALEIVDRVARGGTGITFNYTTLTPLEAPEFRAFFRGGNTVAEYHGNYSAQLTGPNRYSWTLTSKLPDNRPLKTGDRIEIEVSQFLKAPLHGRKNYYGTAMLYVVGQGVVPWEGVGAPLDSSPLPETAWLGGLTTLPYQYSNEPEHRFKQMAGNLSPVSAQPFLLGRRLHHTDFGSGVHSEPGNPAFETQAGKLGPHFVEHSCIACHVNNGRALPPAVDGTMYQTVLKVGSEEPFVTNITGGSSNTSAGVTTLTPPTLTYQPFFSGISLDVTPQIDEFDTITLHVHSMVNSILEKEKISLPAANAARVPFAVNSISETDSVVKTKDGQVVVIGGLMTESMSDDRSKVPGAGDVPLVGALFGKGARRTVKRELVILLKPTVVKGDETWASDINATQGRIEQLNSTPPRPALQ